MLGVATVNAADPVSDREYLSRGTYCTEADALRAARQLIDEQLLAAIATGCSPERAFQEWTEFGEIPSILALGAHAPTVDFDPFSYAIEWVQRFMACDEQPQVTGAPSDRRRG
jgi:hypothetical protein